MSAFFPCQNRPQGNGDHDGEPRPDRIRPMGVVSASYSTSAVQRTLIHGFDRLLASMAPPSSEATWFASARAAAAWPVPRRGRGAPWGPHAGRRALPGCPLRAGCKPNPPRPGKSTPADSQAIAPGLNPGSRCERPRRAPDRWGVGRRWPPKLDGPRTGPVIRPGMASRY